MDLGKSFYLRGEFAGIVPHEFKIFGLSNGEKASADGRGKAFVIEKQLPVIHTEDVLH